MFFVAIIWVLEILNLALDRSLSHYGLVPREIDRLYGIVTMPFLHGNLPHLIANTLPLAILGFLVCATKKALPVTLTIMLLTGILVWVAARDGNHIGASGLVMGYFGYLVSAAFFDRSVAKVLVMIVTVVVYGGLIFTLLDFRSGISFEGHIFGFVSGIISAKLWR